MPLDRLALVLAAVAAACGAWGLVSIVREMVTKWHERTVEEAELELEEMLLQVPAARFLNYGFGLAVFSGLTVFLFIATSGDKFHWKPALALSSVVFVLFAVAPRSVLNFLKKRRLVKFNEQLEEALTSMSNSLKAGFSIMQAIEAIAKQNRQPISLEFRLMLQQTHLGMSLDDALFNMSKRVGSEDFHLVASAIATARMTGGDLTGVFERLASMIRERMRIERRIRTLTAQGRLQGIILGLLPMFLLGALYLLAPDAVINFFTHPLGILLFLVVVFLETCGYLIIRKIVTIDI